MPCSHRGALAILEASFYPGDRARAIGAWSGLAGIGGALGPFLGGWLVQIGTWRLVFLINVPLAALVVAVALRHVPESRDPDAARRLDITGVLTGAVGLAGLTYGFTAWPALGGTSPAVLAALAVGLGGMVGFVFAERRSPHPMVPLEVFASRAFTAANLVTFAVYAALGGVFFLVVLNLQVVAHFTPLAAGIALLPITALLLLLSRSCPWPRASAPAASPTQPPSLRPTEPPCCCALAFSWSAPPSPSPLFLPSSQARTSPSRLPGRCGSTAPSPALHSNPAPRRLP